MSLKIFKAKKRVSPLSLGSSVNSAGSNLVVGLGGWGGVEQKRKKGIRQNIKSNRNGRRKEEDEKQTGDKTKSVFAKKTWVEN